MEVKVQQVTRRVVAQVTLAESMELMAAYQGMQIITIPALDGHSYRIETIEPMYTSEEGHMVSMVVHQVETLATH